MLAGTVRCLPTMRDGCASLARPTAVTGEFRHALEASLTEQLKGAAALAAIVQDGRLFATPAEVAAIMDRDIRTVYGALERGEVPSTRMGQRYSIPVAWLRQASGVPEQAQAAGGAA